MKYFFLVLSLLSLELLYAQEYPSGLEFEDETYAVQPVLSAQEGGKSMPSSIDLSVYCPIPRHQGTIFSCVGWSVGYGALTIERAIQNNWTDRVHITNESSSALFLYNQIKISECNRGSRISDALDFLQSTGDCLAKYFDKNLDDCTQLPTPELIKHAQDYKISDYASVFQPDDSDEEKTTMMRRALAQKKPVIIGLRIRMNFYKLENADFWYPNMGDTTFAGGHAMVVVGYDDNRGAFQLFNSWGTQWGKNGFIWVKYADFARFVKYAYVVYLGQREPIELVQNQRPRQASAVSANPETKPSTSPANPAPVSTPIRTAVTAASNTVRTESKPTESALRELSGQFRFMHFSGRFSSDGSPVFEEAQVAGQKNIYQLSGSNWAVGERFQLQIAPDQCTGYIYVLSLDATGKAEIHWPKDEALNEKFKGKHESALSPFAGGFVRIPGDTRVMKLAQPGLEQLLILFSEKKIQPAFMQYLRDNLAGSGENMPQKLQEILGAHQLPVSEAHFVSDAMQFKAITRHPGAIIPLVLQIIVQ